jgi:hypothetical protein
MREWFEGDPDYEEIKAELEPFITKIAKTTDKTTLQYIRFKKNFLEWKKRDFEALKLIGMLDPLEELQFSLMKQLQTTAENRPKIAVVNLFRYLGYVESIGVSTMDMLVLLLIANGRDLHVERVHEVPRIVHAIDSDDIKRTSLYEKIEFLKRDELIKCSSLIDRELRNAIAHLKFKIDDEGNISIYSQRRWRNVDMFERINTFVRIYMMISFTLRSELLRI